MRNNGVGAMSLKEEIEPTLDSAIRHLDIFLHGLTTPLTDNERERVIFVIRALRDIQEALDKA
jgi:hypothetical protein